ncbi:MAG: type IX secretion system membrane protein PorP/SprF [Cytophagales bacterium]
MIVRIHIKFLIVFIIFLISIESKTQQLPQYSQYMFNPYLVNPAVAGSSDYFHLNSGFRYQWLGVDGSPVTFYMSGHGHVGKEHPRLRGIHKNQNSWHHGLGFIAFADKSGGTGNNYIFNTYKFGITYAYDMSITKQTRISFGASLGITQIGIDGAAARFSEGSSSIVFNTIGNLVFPDANAGIFIYNKLWYAGVSNYQLFAQRLRSTPFSDPTGVNQLARQYYVTGGGVLRLLRDPVIDMIPSTLIKISENVLPAPISADFNVKITFKQIKWEDDHLIWGGFSYRTQEGLVFMAGFRFNKRYEFGYSYDYTLSQLQARSRGSHEFMIGYRIVPKQRVLSPSDFWY